MGRPWFGVGSYAESPLKSWKCHRSERIDVDDRLGEGLRGFWGQVVPDAALDHPVLGLTWRGLVI